MLQQIAAEIIMPNFLKPSFLVLLLFQVLLSQVFLSYTLSAPPSSDNLKQMAMIAIDRIKSEQHEKGFWISLDSPNPVYTHKAKKQPPLIPSTIIIDLIGPYAAESGLANEMQRARNYLAYQIEDNGLVRYFGRPDQSHIAPQGCPPFSPDADDTALVWRTAINPDRSLLPKTLKRLKTYQDGAGFYRIWLVPQDEYQCFKPGNDPNPVDIVIQLHLIQFFSHFGMFEEKDKLCQLVKNNIGNPKLWVYYTSFLGVLRESALSQLGCDIHIPSSIISKTFDSQKQWLQLAYFVRDYAISTPPEENVVKQILAELAAGDFALIEHNPPLLYHNDMSSNQNYYWSKDVGLALWLRVYWDYISTAHMKNNRK